MCACAHVVEKDKEGEYASSILAMIGELAEPHTDTDTDTDTVCILFTLQNVPLSCLVFKIDPFY